MFYRSRASLLAASCVLLATAAHAAAPHFDVLTTGKVIRLLSRADGTRNRALVVAGADPALATLQDPTCPNATAVELRAYLQSTFTLTTLADVPLDCSKWSPTRGGFRYRDPDGTVRSIRYGQRGLRIEIAGPELRSPGGAVGFVQAQLRFDGASARFLRLRVHNFRRNDAGVILSRKPSAAAAAGEAGFWAVILGDDTSAERQEATRQALEKAARRDRRDGRSRFLLGMLHLYRFGQQFTTVATATPAARVELATSNAWFAKAVPLLWDDASGTGDSRIPGFAAAGTYMQGVLDNDEALRLKGLDDLARAVEVNELFNIFDYMTVLQLAPPGDPLFQEVYATLSAYLTSPATLECGATQPEICGNAGFAPWGFQGGLILFGDVEAKAGNTAQAQFWYTLAGGFGTGTWEFASIYETRIADVAGRVARYQDGDPSNDPLIIGGGHEACAACHHR